MVPLLSPSEFNRYVELAKAGVVWFDKSGDKVRHIVVIVVSTIVEAKKKKI